MKKFVVVASAVIAGVLLSPQIRATAGNAAGQLANAPGEMAGRELARKLRRHGFWGFGRARVRHGYLYLQAYRSPGVPVMVKLDTGSGRIVAIRKFAHRHQRTGVRLPGTGRAPAGAGAGRSGWLS